MKNRFVKLACILTMLALTLTGCSLIAVDPVMQADDDMAKLKKELSTPVATYDGGTISRFDVTSDFYNQYSYMYYVYSMYGYTMDETQTKSLLEEVVKAHMNTRATLLKAQEMGITLTDDEIAACKTSAQTSYQTAYDKAYGSATGDSEDMKVKNTESALYQQGVTLDYFVNQQEWTKLVDKVEEKVKGEITEISEDDLATRFAAQQVQDENTYSKDLASFETGMNDATKCITWMPEGYRTIKHVLVKVDDAVLKPVTDARNALNTAKTDLATFTTELAGLDAASATLAPDATVEATAEPTATATPRSPAEIQADIDAKQAEVDSLAADLAVKEEACIASVQTKLDEIYAKLDSGASFDDVMAEYGEDPGMQADPAKTDGYYVSATSTSWDTNFRDAAMALTTVGEYAKTPVISSSGVHIVYYNSDVTPGPVSMDAIHDRFYTVALANAQTDHMNEQVAAWVAALNPVYNYDAFFPENQQ